MTDKLQDYLTNLKMHDAKYQTTFVYGAEETGKTKFLSDVQQDLEKSNDWYFIKLDNDKGDLLHQLINKLQNLTGINVLEDHDLFAYDECLSILLICLKKQGKSILVGIDNIKISDDIRVFTSEYQILIGKELDISLLMAGMPEDIAEVQNDNAISFLLRSNRIQL